MIQSTIETVFEMCCKIDILFYFKRDNKDICYVRMKINITYEQVLHRHSELRTNHTQIRTLIDSISILDLAALLDDL